MMPFTHLSQQLIIDLVQFVTMWLNAFLQNTGISHKWSPHELIYPHKLDVKEHYKTPFGAYCEVHDELTPQIQ